MASKSKNGQDLVDAVMSRDLKNVRKILHRGANLNHVQRGDTAIHLAARHGDKDIISALLRAGDSVNKGNQNGNTPLHFVARGGRETLIHYLIGKGADVNIQNEDGDSPLHASVGYQPMDVIERYVKIGMEVNKQNKNGDTPLHVAVSHSRDESVEALLLCKADVNVTNNQGKRAYELAMHDSLAELIKTYSLLLTAMESGYIRAEGTKFRHTDVKSPVDLKRVGITMETMSLDQNSLATFYCRREKYENNSVKFVTEPEEEVLSDVYHFRVRDVIDEITATFKIPIYAEPSDKQEIVLKFLTGKGGTQVIKDHVKSDENIFCEIETVLVPETTTVVVMCLCTKKQSSVVGEEAQRINSEVEDNFALDIPEGAFKEDTLLSLKVFEHDQERAEKDAEEVDGDDTKSIYSITSANADEYAGFDDVSESQKAEGHTERVDDLQHKAGSNGIPTRQDERKEEENDAVEMDNDQSDKENIKSSRRKLRKRKASLNLLSDVFQVNITGEQPTKSVKMQLPLSENATDIVSGGVKVIRVNDSDDKDVEVLESETIVEGDKVTFNTEHFSTFVVCPVKCTDLSKIVMDIQNAKNRRQAARFFVMVRMLEDEITHVLVVECIKSELSHERRRRWKKKGFKKQRPKHTSKIMLSPSQEFFVELSGEARFDDSIGETGQRRLVFSPHRASFQPYQITLPTLYTDGKACVHILTSDKDEKTTTDSVDKTDLETFDDVKKVEVAQLKIKLKLPPEEDPFGADVEEAFTHKTLVELRRSTLRSYWMNMKYSMMQVERLAIRSEQVQEHSRYLQKQKRLEEERTLKREQTRLQSEKLRSRRILFPTDILSSSMKAEDDNM